MELKEYRRYLRGLYGAIHSTWGALIRCQPPDSSLSRHAICGEFSDALLDELDRVSLAIVRAL